MAVQHGKGTEYVKTNAHAAMMAATLVFGGALLNVECSATPRGITNIVTTTQTYAPGSAEVAFIHAWIRDKSPGHGPLVSGGEITVRNTSISSGVMTSAAPDSSPPAPLPASGSSGQTITIASTQADGAFESWRYTWNGSPGGDESWGLNGYEYKKGNRDIQ